MGKGFNKILDKCQCEFCFEVFENITLSTFSNHKRWCKSNPNRKNKQIKICNICESIIKRNSKCRICFPIKHSEESKLKISIGRKKYLSENKDKHNWSLFKNEETDPELKFKEILSTYNLRVYQYYIPPENDRFFELDFAIPNKKLAFEINGNQHYNSNGTLAKYYQDRHDYFIKRNWKLVEIPYLKCYDEEFIRKCIETFLSENDIEIEKLEKSLIIPIYKKNQTAIIKCQITWIHDKIFIVGNKKRQKIRKNNTKEFNRILYNEEQKIFIPLIENSNIDFSKFGWVNGVSKIINQTPQKVNNWMKRFMIDFYEEKCFKRKPPVAK